MANYSSNWNAPRAKKAADGQYNQLRRERTVRENLERIQRVGGSLGFDLSQLAGLEGAERDAVLKELKEVEEAFRLNPLLGYRPHPRQQQFHAAIGLPVRAFFAGNRAGKTTCTMVESIVQAIDEKAVPPHLAAFKRFYAPFYCRVVTPDLGNTMEGVVLQKIREWCPREQLRGGAFEKAYDKVLRTLHFRNGSWFQFMSNDQDLDKFGGAALHRVVYDEEPRWDIFKECRWRLVDYGGDQLFGMTPLLGLSWCFEELYEPWTRKELPEGTCTICDVEDNPHIDPREIERALEGLSKEERQARKSGRFVHFEGLVYDEFSKQKHIIPSAPIPEAAEVFVGIDPGIRHMAGVVFCYLDDEDTMVAFDELALQGKTIREVCGQIKHVCARHQIWPRWFVIDPASRNKNHQTGRSDQQEYADHGVVCLPGQNSVTAGINRVKERLQADPPRLVIQAHCQELRREFERYRWMRSKRSEGDPREAPVKKDDHLIDALRYLSASRPLAPHRPRSVSLSVNDRIMNAILDRTRIPEHPSGAGIFE